MLLILPMVLNVSLFANESETQLEPIRVSDDGSHFVGATTGDRFVVWGVNYDHNHDGLLLEDYWHDQWETIVDDFQEIKQLGCNVVRVHLQFAKFMKTADQPNPHQLKKLAKLISLAEQTKLYLDITGLGCYHKQDVPGWYDDLNETMRWESQARFWAEISKVCQKSPAIFCYDLMNEPIIGGADPQAGWLAGELGGKHFVQRITLTPGERSREEIAKAWIERLTKSIRNVDQRTMITVGAIPWAHTWPNAKPLFHDPVVGKPLDFVAVHFYPKKGDIEGSLKALKVYDIGKLLVIEEMFPLKCSLEEMNEFIEGSQEFTDGWVSFYWGKTAEENKQAGDIRGAIMAQRGDTATFAGKIENR